MPFKIWISYAIQIRKEIMDMKLIKAVIETYSGDRTVAFPEQQSHRIE